MSIDGRLLGDSTGGIRPPQKGQQGYIPRVNDDADDPNLTYQSVAAFVAEIAANLTPNVWIQAPALFAAIDGGSPMTSSVPPTEDSNGDANTPPHWLFQASAARGGVWKLEVPGYAATVTVSLLATLASADTGQVDLAIVGRQASGAWGSRQTGNVADGSTSLNVDTMTEVEVWTDVDIATLGLAAGEPGWLELERENDVNGANLKVSGIKLAFAPAT